MSTYDNLAKVNACLEGHGDALVELPAPAAIQVWHFAAPAVSFLAETLDEGRAVAAAFPDAKWEQLGGGEFVCADVDGINITLWTTRDSKSEATYTAADLTAEAVTA